MTNTLLQAFEQAKTLPEKDQEAIGSLLLEEMAAEAKWQKSFAANPGKMKKLADGAKEEIARGYVSPNDWSDNPFAGT